MKKTVPLIFSAIILLSGCVTTPTPPPLTDKQISEVNDAALCSLSNTHIDPRINTEINSRKLDCDPTSLVCTARGIKKGTKKFSQCKADQVAEYTLQAQKRANPALGYCMDSGFKTGTDAIATCMSSYNQQRHNQFMFERQQEAQRDEASQRAAQERARRWDETMQENNDRFMDVLKNNQQRTAPAEPLYKSPSQTHCTPDGYGGMRCTTY